MIPIIVAGLFMATIGWLAATGDLPVAVPVVYAAGSILAFVFYGLDKSAAASGRRRTPEDTLLALGLLGGWPGALIAQRVLRHKSGKASFQVMFWLSVVLNCVVLAWFVWRR
jgi:uncharacterized membrane protein YsdA (DUF1294 family)